jgi:hypothetical protein
MTRLISWLFGLASLWSLVPGRFRIVGLLFAIVPVVIWAMQCRHRGPLGLLPSVTDATGQRLPPRWYCDDCGRSWPADLEHQQTPVQRFKGYDESKAVSAARRANELEMAQRALAIRRAGLAASPDRKGLRAIDGGQQRLG